ncbi:MAG: hypothetical protein J6Y32_05135 [Bacteroidales bacterium]|nr:hypothetical protein [Bacteroidales bacterium]
MDKKQKEIAAIKALPKGNYHLCTDGWKEGKLFNSEEQFKMGMSTVALISLVFEVKIRSFVLMPNHIHLLIYASGKVCLRIFRFMKRRINHQLVKDGCPSLPKSYGMKLIPIEDVKSMRNHFIYLSRNAYEKNFCVPEGYPWGSIYLPFNRTSEYIRGVRVEDMNLRDVRSIIGTYVKLPDNWEIHPSLGVLPRNYIHSDGIRELFDTPKSYMTKLVKDYESFVHLSQELGEEFVFSRPEAEDIMLAKLRSMYPGKWLRDLTTSEKGRLAVQLNRQYTIPAGMLAEILYVPEHTLTQFINSKEFGFRRA